MEIKEALDILKGICPNGFALVPLISNEKEALQTAISHLETLQKVKEAGGVKKRIVQIRDSDNGLYRSKGAICIHGINMTRGDRLCIECANDRGFNQALDLKDAELAGKLEGLKDIFAKTKGCKPNQEDCSFGKCHDWSGCKIQQQAIRELFLGEKGGRKMEADVKEVSINGKVYVLKGSEQAEITGDIKIVVLQRGWIVIGRFEREAGGTQCKLHNASVIRNWGTTQGLGEIALGGPTANTMLDKCHGIVQFDYLTVVLTIDCEGKKWQNKC